MSDFRCTFCYEVVSDDEVYFSECYGHPPTCDDCREPNFGIVRPVAGAHDDDDEDDDYWAQVHARQKKDLAGRPWVKSVGF